MVAERIVSIADSYRAISEDITRAAEVTKDEEVRRAYLALAGLWWARSVQLESGLLSVEITPEPHREFGEA